MPFETCVPYKNCQLKKREYDVIIELNQAIGNDIPVRSKLAWQNPNCVIKNQSIIQLIFFNH